LSALAELLVSFWLCGTNYADYLSVLNEYEAWRWHIILLFEIKQIKETYWIYKYHTF